MGHACVTAALVVAMTGLGGCVASSAASSAASVESADYARGQAPHGYIRLASLNPRNPSVETLAPVEGHGLRPRWRAVPAAERPRAIVVAQGETLYGISETYQIALRALIDANGLEPPFNLQPGATLTLPPPKTHRVEKGETLYSIAQRYRVHPPSLGYLNGLRAPYNVSPGDAIILPALARDWSATPAVQPVAVASVETTPSRRFGAGAGGVHIVAKGDTLYSIARGAGSTVGEVAALNAIPAPYTLAIGQAVRLPGEAAPAPSARSHTVRRGDTLYSIARANGVTHVQLAALNDIAPPYTLAVGQTLSLGAASTAPSPQGPPRRFASDKGPRTFAGAGTHGRATKSALSADGFQWPLSGRVVRGFEGGASARANAGLNIAAVEGQPVSSAGDGRVIYAGDELRGYGRLLLIEHDDGWVSAYAHLSEISVKEEQTVKAGQKVGKAGSTGAVDQAQLHFELRRHGRPMDPKRHLPPLRG